MKEKITKILIQFWWPINISYQSKQLNNITQELIDFHNDNIKNFENYWINELFSLYHVVDFAVKELWDSDFSIVTWLDLYKDWYTSLDYIASLIRNKT